MVVLHVVSVYSENGSSGGPVRVALSQTEVLGEAMIDTLLIGSELEGDPVSNGRVRTFRGGSIPRLGPAGVFSFRLFWWVLRNSGRFDRIHIHMSRDLVTLPVAAIAMVRRIPYFVQTHGMITKSSRPLARILDRLIVRRLLRRARSILALTAVEVKHLLELEPGLPHIEIVPNAIRIPDVTPKDVNVPREVLFLARMHARKRPEMFVEMARELIEGGDASTLFTLIGPDEGAALPALEIARSVGLERRIVWEGPIASDEVIDRMSGAYLYVLPAEREPFGLTIVEALAGGTPVVVASDAAIAAEIVAADVGATFNGGRDDLVRVVAHYLRDPELRARQAAKAPSVAREQYSSVGLARRLAQIYGISTARTDSE